MYKQIHLKQLKKSQAHFKIQCTNLILLVLEYPAFRKTKLNKKLEQLEHLHSEDTPCRLMITHTIESYWIPSQNKTKSKLHI